jgi:hypothetical protein
VKDRARLRHLERRLAAIGAEKSLTKRDIKRMLDDEVAHWCQIETDRLAQLVQLQTEQHTRNSRKRTG